MADSGGGEQTQVILVIPSHAPTTPTAAPVPTVVVHPRPHLPFTGLDAASLGLLAVLLVVLGALLLIKGRTRPPALPRSS